MSRYAVVLDACVLVPIVLADTMLRIAEKGLYRPEARASPRVVGLVHVTGFDVPHTAGGL